MRDIAPIDHLWPDHLSSFGSLQGLKDKMFETCTAEQYLDWLSSVSSIAVEQICWRIEERERRKSQIKEALEVWIKTGTFAIPMQEYMAMGAGMPPLPGINYLTGVQGVVDAVLLKNNGTTVVARPTGNH